jgi:4-hydroxy-2-oxoheptanedioate aldolase
VAGFGISKATENPVKSKLAGGQPALGSWLSLCSPVAAELMAPLGWDWLVVDAQHSPVGFETMVNCFRAIQLGGSVPMARVPWNETTWIQRTLDAGALGLVVPMVNSRADAENVVANMKYGPRGIRSSGGSRVSTYVETPYTRFADDQIAVIVMIETITAAEQAEEILSVEGVDGCFIGPNDLALSMGLPPDQSGPGTRVEEVIMQILEACKKVGKAAGKHCYDSAEVSERISQGFQFLALASDSRFMMAEARAQFTGIQKGGAPGASGRGPLYP